MENTENVKATCVSNVILGEVALLSQRDALFYRSDEHGWYNIGGAYDCNNFRT